MASYLNNHSLIPIVIPCFYNSSLYKPCLCQQEFAEALREYAPQHEGIEQAEAAAAELEEVRRKLDQQREQFGNKLKKDQKCASPRKAIQLIFYST